MPLLMEQWRDENKPASALFDAVQVYNAVPHDLEDKYRTAVQRAFADFVSKE